MIQPYRRFGAKIDPESIIESREPRLSCSAGVF
jgi:hypothetical protein